MGRQLISATPSPYARKVRISLLEKSLPFELLTEVPWNSTTQTKLHNPLEKLPVLLEDGKDPVYESHLIMEYLELEYPDRTPMLSTKPEERLFAKKVEVVADGMCDALVLRFFEKQRQHPSEEWIARQMRKVDGGFAALNTWVKDPATGKEKDFIIGDKLGLADIAAGAVCGYVAVRFSEYGFQDKFPELGRYFAKLEQRDSFKQTVPSPQTITDKIV